MDFSLFIQDSFKHLPFVRTISGPDTEKGTRS